MPPDNPICDRCGYNLSGIPRETDHDVVTCSECGWTSRWNELHLPQQRRRSLAIKAIVAVVLVCVVGPLVLLGGILLMALVEPNDTLAWIGVYTGLFLTGAALLATGSFAAFTTTAALHGPWARANHTTYTIALIILHLAFIGGGGLLEMAVFFFGCLAAISMSGF